MQPPTIEKPKQYFQPKAAVKAAFLYLKKSIIMSQHITSITESAADMTIINIECHMTQGLPAVIIVGFANRAVDEAKERLRGAFAGAGIDFPKKRIAINLAPADVPKESSSFDLGIAIAVMKSA